MSSKATKEMCCTCLSKNRKLFQLCRVPDGINLMYSLLACDADAFREGFYKDPGSWLVCWECRATVRKFKQFQQQACTALKRRTEIILQCTIESIELRSLSKLSVNELPSIELFCEEFIDCGSIPNDIKQEQNTNLKHEKYYKNQVEDEVEYKNEVVNDNDVCFGDKVSYGNGNELLDIKIEISNNMNEDINKIDNCEDEVISEVTKKKRISKKKKICMNGLKLDKVKYPCAECDMIFDNKGAKWKHVQKCHRDGHKCATCDKVFSFKHNLERHQQTHQSAHPRVQCPTCHKLVRVTLLATHSRTHAQRERVSCAQCDKEFVCRATYESHLKYARAHAGPGTQVFKYKCESCDKRFRSRGELRDHSDFRHDSRARHKCPICDKLLATRRCVTRHVKRTHEGVKENARDKMCDHCGKAFRDAKSLREHVWRHTGARPLSCVHCGRAFRQRAALHKHTRTLHHAAQCTRPDTHVVPAAIIHGT